MQRISLKQLSEITHYSMATISRALNNSPLISAATKEEITKAAYIYGYYSKNIEINKKYSYINKTIAFCVNDISNPMCQAIIQGIEDYTNTYKFHLITMDSRNLATQEAFNITYLKTIHVDGLIVLPVDMTDESTISNDTSDIPIVYVCNNYSPGKANYVGINYFSAAYKACEYLINLGHTKIAYIGSTPRLLSRELGVKSALDDYKIKYTEEDFYKGTPVPENGQQIMESIILNKKDYTAIIASNDYIAYGAMNCMLSYGFKVPDDYSVIGFDNMPMSSYAAINLSTIEQPGFEIGKKAAEILCDKILNHNPELKYHLFDTRLIIRNSCKKLN